ncbi:DUF4328 domain-containing protein [Caulobacter sp. KR2-114]|uniref:DUF4328 domain-containing protein n=1 Tax=Caulobacter sp. KR2-114 TaxID=3400912 RepID=UPI003C006B6A
MTDTSVGGADGPIFREIGQAQPQAAIPFLSPQGLAIATTTALALKATLSLVEIVGLAMRVKVISDARRLGPGLAATLQSDAHLADTVVQASGAIGLLSLIACYVIAGMWIYRAARNVRALGARGLDVTPGWAVGSYAVPIMNWFRPLVAMSEIWRASRWPDRWRSQSMPPMMGFWWAGWLATGVLGNIVYAMSKAGSDLGLLMTINELSLLDLTFEIATIGLFLTIVWQVTRAQKASRHQVQQVAETFA